MKIGRGVAGGVLHTGQSAVNCSRSCSFFWSKQLMLPLEFSEVVTQFWRFPTHALN